MADPSDYGRPQEEEEDEEDIDETVSQSSQHIIHIYVDFSRVTKRSKMPFCSP